MADADVPSKHLTSITAVKAHYVVPVHRLSHCHGRRSHHFRFPRLPKLANSPVNRRDEIGKLIRGQLMMTNVAADYPCCEKRVIDSGFHEHRPAKSRNDHIPAEGTNPKGFFNIDFQLLFWLIA
jgi:hypothetical protein